MNYVMSLVEQLRQFWNRANLTGRIAIASGLALVLVTVTAVGFWSSRPQYVPLATNLAPTETAEIVSVLNAQGIPNKMNFAGSGVLVPKKQWNAARTAAGELINPALPSDTAMDGSMFSDTTMNHFRLLKAKEDDLERSILRLRAVQSADVHIAQPKRSPFARSQQPTTASVVLGIHPGAVFTQEQAATIVAHVAGSVEGLTEENVTVSDLEGHTYTGQARLGEGGILSRLDYRSRLEARLATKAETMLAHKLGPHKSIVRVSADIDFTEKKRTQTTYDADSKVKSHESIETQTGVVSGSGGVVGSGNNGLGGGTQSRTAAPVSGPGNSERIDVTYANGAIIEDTTQFGGEPTRLTIAAMVDLGSDATGAGPTPATADVTQEQIAAIIKNAVGFDSSRSDQIEVVITTLAPPTDTIVLGVSETRKWEFVNQLARNSSLGLAAVSALIIAFITLRKIQPITISAGGSDEEARRERLLSDLSHRVQENPETVSRILAAWLKASAGTGDNASDSPADTIPLRRAA